MFLHPERLLHVLTPEWYYTRGRHDEELHRLLIPGWHFVSTRADLARGPVSLTLLDRPLRLRLVGEEVQACLKARGEARFRAERCGELAFVNLSELGPSLREQLGDVFRVVETAFSSPFRQVWRWQTDYAANWKIPLENGVESYHIPCLHQKTFRNFPKEENVVHEIHPGWTSYRTDEMDAWVVNGIRRTARWLGLPFTGAYMHYHVFPNLTFVVMDLMSMAQIVVPTSPTTSRTMVWLYAPFGPRRGVLPWLFAKLNALASREVTKRVLAEDAPIFADVQRGLQSSSARGVIGRREERVWAFQDHVARAVDRV